jgi:hypothetical protein
LIGEESWPEMPVRDGGVSAAARRRWDVDDDLPSMFIKPTTTHHLRGKL